MSPVWTKKAFADLKRLYEFLSPVDSGAALHAIQTITAAAARLERFPRLGERLDGYDPREVRRVFAGSYEVRYEVRSGSVVILRLWHARERR